MRNAETRTDRAEVRTYAVKSRMKWLLVLETASARPSGGHVRSGRVRGSYARSELSRTRTACLLPLFCSLARSMIPRKPGCSGFCRVSRRAYRSATTIGSSGTYNGAYNFPRPRESYRDTQGWREISIVITHNVNGDIRTISSVSCESALFFSLQQSPLFDQ